jgi:hypothetical protein
VKGAIRVEGGRCVRPADASVDGSPPGDAGLDAGDAHIDDAGGDADGTDACMPAEACNGSDDDCDGRTDEGLMLNPVGSMMALTTGGGFDGQAAIAAHPEGYLVVFSRPDRLLYYLRLRADGTPADLSGSVAIDPGTIGPDPDSQRNPAISITAGVAAVVWQQDSGVRGRAIPIDGSSPPAPVQLALSDGATRRDDPFVATISTQTFVGWTESTAAEDTVMITSHRTVFEAEPGKGTTAYTAVSRLDDGAVLVAVGNRDAFLLLGVLDQRAGNAAPRAYVDRIETAPLIAERSPIPITGELGAMERASLTGVAVEHTLGAPPGAAFLVTSRDAPGGVRRQDLVYVDPGALGGSAIGVIDTATFSSGRFYVWSSMAAAGPTVALAWSEAVGVDLESVLHVTGWRGTPMPELMRWTGTIGVPRRCMALRSEASGALLQLTSSAPDVFDLHLQLLGCVP